MRERECSAEHHESNCPCQRCQKNSCGNCKKTNRDHFTAKAVARELGWSRSQAERQANIQLLSYECHQAKDASTPARMEIARRLSRGEKITLQEYQNIIKRFR